MARVLYHAPSSRLEPQRIMVASDASHPTNDLSPLNIALLGYRSNPYSGGQGVYLKHLSKALVDMGHRVDVISGEPYPELDSRVGLIKLPGLKIAWSFF